MYQISVTVGLVLGGLALFLLAFALARRSRARTAAKAGRRAGATAPGSEPLVRRVELRLDEIEARIEAQAAAQAAAGSPEDRLRAMAGSLVGLIRDKNATLETALAGLDQLRARLRALEQMGDLAEARGLFERLEARIDELRSAQAAAAAAVEERIAGLKSRAEAEAAPQAALAEQFGQLYAQKDASTAAMLARLAPFEARLAELEGGLEGGRAAETAGREALTRLEARIETLRGGQEAALRDLAALRAEVGAGAAPVVAIAERLSGLHAQKEALVETLLARLTQLEEDLAAQDPRAALDRFAQRLEAAQAAREAAEAGLRDRVAALETPGENPFAEISEQLTRLYAQKDAAVETVFARLAPLEARLAGIEDGLAGQNPQAALDRFAERLEAVQARLSLLETPEVNPFAEISEQLTRLYAQKDATVETVFARLAPLEARLAGIEADLTARDPRAALDVFAERLEAAQAAREAAEAGLRDRVAALETPGENPFAEISEQLTRLYAQKDATVETVFARLAPLEARLAEMEAGLAARDPQAALDTFAERLEALRGRLSQLEIPGENPFAEISEQLTRLYAQKDAAVETVFARLAPLEARLAGIEDGLAGQNPQAALDRFAERLEAVQARLSLLETPEVNPFAEISEQLTRLYAQKDATVETVFARLAPLEARLAGIEADLTARDPRAALDVFAERLEAAQAAREAAEAGLRDRVAALETPGENPFAEISEQLTRLYAQKDATVETVFARLAPLEARLAGIEDGLAGQDPQAALDRFAERLEAVQARLSLLETPEVNPFAEISEQLTRLYAQKDTTVETVFVRLAPLEARLATIEADVTARDPRAALDVFAERLEAAQAAREAAEAGLRDRVAALETPGENPFAEISEQLTRLYAQKDATVETVFARLAPLEARLAEMEAGLAARDPQAALDTFAERLEALRGRLSQLEIPGENPFAEISEQLTRLYAQKDAAVETVFARLAPLEARLAGIEDGLAGSLPRLAALEAGDPRAALEDLGARMEALRDAQGVAGTRIEALRAALGAAAAQPFAEIADQLTQLYAQKDAGIVAVLARLVSLEARLAELEARPAEGGEDEARAEAQAIATQMIAARAAAEQTELFANRLALLEASLPRLSADQARLARALEHQSAPPPAAAPPTAASSAEATGTGAGEPAADLAAIRDLPRVVSLHHK